jgi:hypothetical protein
MQTNQTNRRTFLATAFAAAFAGPLAVGARPLSAADRKDSDRKDGDRKDGGKKDAGEWEKLGQKEAGRKEERDVIEVTSPYRFTALSFRVEEGDVELDDVKVTFDDDKTFSPDTKLRFREGERSGKIDLPGQSRVIKRVRFLYRSTGGKRAVIQLFGKVGDAAKK